MKKCNKCGCLKSDEDFPFRSKGKRANRCLVCTAVYLALYREANRTPESRAAFLADVAARRATKAEAARARKKVFRADYEKRPHVVQYRTAYKAKPERRAITRELKKRPEKLAHRAAKARTLRSTDPKFLLNGRMSCLIRAKLRGGKAGRTWRSMVDYTVNELRAHLERQFLPGMGWHNANEWHVDHIIPSSSFNYAMPADPEFRRCWDLPNLRPLWRLDNIRKHARIETLL